MVRGKQTCKILKEIRRQIAEANDIEFITSECQYQGDCLGTCPKCEAEVRYLEQQLERKQIAGKAITVLGISAGLIAMTPMTSCTNSANKGMNKEVSSDTTSYENLIMGEPVPTPAEDTIIASIKDAPPPPPPAPTPDDVLEGDICEEPPVVVGFVAPDISNTSLSASDTLEVAPVMPEFPGGQQALIQFLGKKIKYPTVAQGEMGPQGHPLLISAKEKIGIELIRQAILEKLPSDFGQQNITGKLVTENDLVLLVMPQDIQAPKGRLILPQVQTIRELLDKKCLVMTCTTDKFSATLQALARPPKLIITDSQVFKAIYEQKPAESELTSFSVLFAGYKGDIHYYVESAAVIERLTESSRVLIAEACTHAPLSEDIGRVKLPRLLRKRIGENLQIDMVAGTDFPQDLTPYSLVIHCGACMFNRKYVLSRIERAREQHIPMTNYGVAIAFLNGILDQIKY